MLPMTIKLKYYYLSSWGYQAVTGIKEYWGGRKFGFIGV